MLRNQTYSDATQVMGDTPLIKLNRVIPQGGATVYAKCEFFNPLNSVKDRIGVAMIRAGEESGALNSETHVVEPRLVVADFMFDDMALMLEAFQKGS